MIKFFKNYWLECLNILVFMLGVYIYFYHKWRVEDWLGTGSISFSLSVFTMSFTLTLKVFFMAMPRESSEGRLVSFFKDYPKVEADFHKHMDGTIVASLFVIIINMVYLVINTFSPLSSILDFIPVIMLTVTTYIISSVVRLLVWTKKLFQPRKSKS